ncbi:hypothetical protein NL393_38540, partial [Klebsiella pneumoniae]|nr:hypothetical protein [Klebsiella pneumoniae]
LIRETVEAKANHWEYSSIPVAKDTADVDSIMGGDGVDPACIFTTEWQPCKLTIGRQTFNGMKSKLPYEVDGIMKHIATRH